MNIKSLITIAALIIFSIVLNGCANSQFNKKYNKPFKHNTPLIKDQKVVNDGKSEIAKTLEMGPKPIEGDTRKLAGYNLVTLKPIFVLLNSDTEIMEMDESIKLNSDINHFLYPLLN